MKRIIEIPDHVVKAIQNGEDYRYDIHTAIAQSTPYNPSGDLISRSALKEQFIKAGKDYNHECVIEMLSALETIDNAPTVELRDNFDLGYVKGLEDGKREAEKWIKITYRPMTKEEEIAYKREFGIDYGDTLLEYENKVFTCELPNDKQDILIQTNWGVKQDTCDWSDGYCGLEENGDWDGVIAWRPLPEPHKESEAENE